MNHPSAPSVHQQVVRRAIQQVSRALADECGYGIAMGAELEYVHLHTEDAPKMPKGKDEDKSKTPLPYSRIVGYGYYESGNIAPRAYAQEGVRQLEAVIDHRRGLSPAGVADALASLQKEVAGLPMRMHAPVSPRRVRIAEIAALRAEALRMRQEDGVVATSLRSELVVGACNGMHLNVSLVPLREGVDPVTDYTPFRESCHTFFERESALLCVHPSEQMRWNVELDSKASVRSKDKQHGAYLENKMPAATNSPHVAVLLQLAAIYQHVHAPGARGLAGVLAQVMPQEDVASVMASCRALAEQDRTADMGRGGGYIGR